MPKFAVVKTGGKQYLVKEKDHLTVDLLSSKKGDEIELETLTIFDSDKEAVELGSPALKNKTRAKVIENLKGDKIRVAKFKAKVRYRRVKGFRPQLSKIEIIKIA